MKQVDQIPVFYNPMMSIDSGGYSPSASKPAQVVQDWQTESLPIDVRLFLPCQPEDLFVVHDQDYVREVLAGRRPNGHGNRTLGVAESCLWTTGSFVAAAHEAARNGSVACSPSSGFHHASFDSGRGFCTFNGLMMAAAQLIQANYCVGILDCDAHYGDGTAQIASQFQTPNMLFQMNFHQGMPGAFDWIEFEDNVLQFLHDLMEIEDTSQKILLYQAGADVHVDDPLGPGPDGMTSDEMRRRDRLVFETCLRLELPVVWNLAGGYQRDEFGGIAPVLQLHRQTMEECVRCFVRRPCSAPV